MKELQQTQQEEEPREKSSQSQGACSRWVRWLGWALPGAACRRTGVATKAFEGVRAGSLTCTAAVQLS
jgi:hypothetical protein